MSKPNTTPAVSPRELTERQLADWQQLHADLTLNQDADAEQINYALAQIERLQAELDRLTNQ